MNGALHRSWRGGTGGPPGWKWDHPASRPGTGRPMVWRNQMHVISPSLRCFVCGLYEDRATAGQCYCGAINWTETGLPPAPRCPQAGICSNDVAPTEGYVGASNIPSIVVVDYEGARLNELLGGIKKGALLLVVGAAGAGKSTCCAELAAFAARYWSRSERGDDRQPDCKIYWMDSDQKDASLVRECFRVAEVDGAFVHRVRLLPERREPYSFDEALRLLPPDARVLVCDSLEKWGTNDTERLAVLDKLRAHPAWLKLVISGTNKLGGVSGAGALERADDATIIAERTADARYTLRFTKRRWQPCASAKARGPGEVGAQERAQVQIAPPVSLAPERPTLDAQPDAIEVLQHARAALRDQLRADRVPLPRATRDEGTALLDEEAREEAGLPFVEPNDVPPSEEATGLLPERMDTPYALLLRSWPWTEGVRVATLLAAWRSDERSIPGLCRALRELTGTTDGSIPTAIKIGNALRWARGHSLDGMTLTCQRDRMKIAIWRVVRER